MAAGPGGPWAGGDAVRAPLLLGLPAQASTSTSTITSKSKSKSKSKSTETCKNE